MISLVTSCGPSAPGSTGSSGSEDDELATRRRRLAAQIGREVDDSRVVEAFATVPRHRFVPESHRALAYENQALRIGEGQVTLRPSRIALMLATLELDGSERVLEIGTGSGYQAALLGQLAAEIFSIEIRASLQEAAREQIGRLRKEGLVRAKRLELLVGDGSKGWPDEQPYDCIVVTAAVDEVPSVLVGQLRVGGRLLIPVGRRSQKLVLIERTENGETRRTIDDVRLQPLDG